MRLNNTTLKQHIFTLLLICTFYFLNAQEKILYGSPSTRGAELHLKGNNNYDIVLTSGRSGTITSQEETVIYIDDIGYELEGFKVTETYSKYKNKNISVNFFRKGLISDYDNYYIGFKSNGQKNFTYLNLSYETLLFNTNNIDPYGFNGFLSVQIPRTDEIQLILKKGEKHYMDQFTLSKNTDNVYVDYREIADKNSLYNSKFFIGEIYGGNKKTLDINKKAFSSIFPASTPVKRSFTDSFSNWKTAELVKKIAFKKFNSSKYKYNPVLTISPPSRNEKYKYNEFDNLKEAIAAVKADNSILLVFNSLLRHNDVADFYYIFDNINSGAEHEYLKEYNYDKYYLHYIKPEDLAELSKYRNTSHINDEVFAVNSNLEIVYTENITTHDFRLKYHGLSQELSENILAANSLNQFNQKLQNKSLTAKDFLDLGQWRDLNIINLGIEKTFQNNDIARLEDIFESTEDIIDDSEEFEKEKASQFKSKVTFNYPKISSNAIHEAINLLIEKHKKDQSINLDYATFAVDYLSSNPFFKEISGGGSSYSPTKKHYEFCLYLSRFPIDTKTIQNNYTKHYDNHYQLLSKVLINEGKKATYPTLVNTTFNNLIKKDIYKYRFIFIYYFDLFNDNKLTFEDFDLLYNEILPKKGNYLEQIQSFYKTCDSCPYIDDLEYYIKSLSNAMAWDAVTKKNTDKVLLQKAKKWSETSVELSPKEHYYLDTLANLEYFLGNKEKAVEIELKAIKIATDSNHDNVSEYKQTLEKIKNNTLKY